MSKLFEDSDSDGDTDFKTNNVFAENYRCWRQKEELNKLKTKYGEEVLDQHDSSTISSDDEDDTAAYVTNETEKEFFKTLASLKRKDPKIYDNNVQFFSETSNTAIATTYRKTKEQPMFIKDYERKMLLANAGHLDDSDDENNESKCATYTEEQENLKNDLKNALQNIKDSENDDKEWGGMFQSRIKTNVELKQEDEDYKQWLKGQKEDINETIKNDLKSLKDYWNDPNLDESERFLKDYILNKRFMESENKDYVPTYDEIIHDSDDGLSEDELQVEKQEEFEHKYNYRFEEPDEEFIKRYPRTIESSLRTKDDRRKLKRAEVKDRKQKEKQMKMEELKQMQSLKKQEIEEKIKKLKEITGNTEIVFDDNDIEDDFDPEAHDRKMQNIFNDEFYNGPTEEQKPEFQDIDEELELENWEKYKFQANCGSTAREPHCEDDDFNMDCDYDPTMKKTSKESKNKRKRKRKTKFAEVLNEPKPTFNPDDKTYQEYLDEYYKLECEDIIGDIPCRFKYRKVVPNDYGLTIEEILTANDRELNKWCSLKKAVQYRPEHIEKYDVIAFGKKGKNESLKRKILPSLFKDNKTFTLTDNSNNEIVGDNSHKLENGEQSVVTSTDNKKIQKNLSLHFEKNKRKTKNKKTSLDLNNSKSKISTEDDRVLNITNDMKIHKKKKETRTPKLSNIEQGTITSNIKNNNNLNDTNLSNDDKSIINNKSSHKRRKYESCGLQNESTKNTYSRKDNLQVIDISDARLKAFGVKPKKFKNKIKYGGNRNTNTR